MTMSTTPPPLQPTDQPSKQPFNCAGSIFVRVTIPMTLLMAVCIFLVGVLIGPLWLTCIGVAIAVATMACTMYLYSVAKKLRRGSSNTVDGGSEELMAGSYEGFSSVDEIYFGNLSTAMRRYLANLRLPSYNETVRRTESGAIQELFHPPEYIEIYPEHV